MHAAAAQASSSPDWDRKAAGRQGATDADCWRSSGFLPFQSREGHCLEEGQMPRRGGRGRKGEARHVRPFQADFFRPTFGLRADSRLPGYGSTPSRQHEFGRVADVAGTRLSEQESSARIAGRQLSCIGSHTCWRAPEARRGLLRPCALRGEKIRWDCPHHRAANGRQPLGFSSARASLSTMTTARK